MSGRSVTVRMYRGILGDCFLLTVKPGPNAARGKRSHILIDCGVLQGVTGAAERMRKIAANIRKETGGKIDCVIVTHEHFDHISGFKYAAELFAGIDIRCLWLAWTEDPADPKGQELQERFGAAHQKFAALQFARSNLGLDREEDHTEESKRVLGLAGFNAPLEAEEVEVLAAGGQVRGSKLILQNLREWADNSPPRSDGREKIEYLRPGDICRTPAENDAPTLRAYVLGPPYEDKYLFKALPSKGAAKETYLLGVDAEDGADSASAHSPFAPMYRWHVERAKKSKPDAADGSSPAPPPVPPFVAQRYKALVSGCRFDGGPNPKLDHHRCELDFVCQHRQDYRQIDDLLNVEQSALALKMDSNTNNSSLVLAFELGDDENTGPTLLFAADAQVGNWQSWEKVEYWQKGHERNAALKKGITTAQLLARARLYKVGHHGSHNATLKAKGLELMIDPELVAMIPTVEDIALEQGRNGWQMPNPETYKGLIRQTKGRILRGDLFWQKENGQDPSLRDQIRRRVEAENQQIATQRLNEEPIEFDEEFAPADEEELYVDLRIEF